MTVSVLDVAKLYETEHSRLRAFVRRLTGDGTVAEDLVQQAFVNLVGRQEPGTETAAYVSRIARNLALNHLRNEKRRAEIEIAGIDTQHIADSRPSPEVTAIYRSELRQLLEVILQLPPRRREAFMLSKVERLSHDEIARRMGISRNTVISQIIAAMAELDRRLPKNNFSFPDH